MVLSAVIDLVPSGSAGSGPDRLSCAVEVVVLRDRRQAGWGSGGKDPVQGSGRWLSRAATCAVLTVVAGTVALSPAVHAAAKDGVHGTPGRSTAVASGLAAHTRAGGGPAAYVANGGSNSVSVIDTGSNTVTANVSVGNGPFGVAETPDGTHAYVTNNGSNNVSVIDTGSNTVTATISVGTTPQGVAVTPD
ncbi:YncE family protein, partial [Streptomyces sp. NPDC057910]|uniref:YncE family protein n=1 Tax=Streptomyces sp. NPDC057910 TaxID=3346278 RepID=UPI0036E5663D